MTVNEARNEIVRIEDLIGSMTDEGLEVPLELIEQLEDAEADYWEAMDAEVNDILRALQ